MLFVASKSFLCPNHFPSCLSPHHPTPAWPNSNIRSVSTYTCPSTLHFKMRVLNVAETSQPSISHSLSNIRRQRHDDNHVLNCPRCGAGIDIDHLQPRPDDPMEAASDFPDSSQ